MMKLTLHMMFIGRTLEKRFEDPLVDAETFRLNYDGSLAEIGKKPKSINDIEGQFMGLLKFTPNGWEKLKEIFDDLQKEDIKKLHMTDILQMLIESNKARIMQLLTKILGRV